MLSCRFSRLQIPTLLSNQVWWMGCFQTLDMEYFAGKKIGDMMTRVMTDPSNINSIILEVFNMIKDAVIDEYVDIMRGTPMMLQL